MLLCDLTLRAFLSFSAYFSMGECLQKLPKNGRFYHKKNLWGVTFNCLNYGCYVYLVQLAANTCFSAERLRNAVL